MPVRKMQNHLTKNAAPPYDEESGNNTNRATAPNNIYYIMETSASQPNVQAYSDIAEINVGFISPKRSLDLQSSMRRERRRTLSSEGKQPCRSNRTPISRSRLIRPTTSI